MCAEKVRGSGFSVSSGCVFKKNLGGGCLGGFKGFYWEDCGLLPGSRENRSITEGAEGADSNGASPAWVTGAGLMFDGGRLNVLGRGNEGGGGGRVWINEEKTRRRLKEIRNDRSGTIVNSENRTRSHVKDGRGRKQANLNRGQAPPRATSGVKYQISKFQHRGLWFWEQPGEKKRKQKKKKYSA